MIFRRAYAAMGGLCIALLGAVATAAEFNGADVDGESFDATAYSWDTARFYDVTVEFSGDTATITFDNGRSIDLTLDDEEIDDPSNISAHDYERGVDWDLDVSGLE